MNRIFNRNNHPIRIERTDGSIFEYPPCGDTFRLETEDRIIDEINGNQIVQRVYYEPDTDIVPRYEAGVYHVVPSQITQLYNRKDFISPDTKQAHGARRSPNGQVLSVKRFRMHDILITRD